MATEITLNIGAKPYRLMVPEGQEQRVQHLAKRVDKVVTNLREAAPTEERDRVLMLAALQLADELTTQETERETEQTNIAAFNENLAQRLQKLLPLS